MRRLTLIGVCLAVVGAFAAVSVASASALPALYECAPAKTELIHYEKKGKPYERTVNTGEYKSDKKCLQGVKYSKDKFRKYTGNPGPEGAYELKEGYGKGTPFTATGKGSNLEAEGIGGVSCTGSSATAHFTSPTAAGGIVATFTGCEYLGRKCISPGEGTGTIVTKSLQAVVGYLSGAGGPSPKAGALFSPESGEVLSEFKCETENFVVEGSVIGEVAPLNKMTKEGSFIFKQKKIGVQEWQKFETGPEVAIHVYLCKSCSNPLTEYDIEARGSFETTDVATMSEELELKA